MSLTKYPGNPAVSNVTEHVKREPKAIRINVFFFCSGALYGS